MRFSIHDIILELNSDGLPASEHACDALSADFKSYLLEKCPTEKDEPEQSIQIDLFSSGYPEELYDGVPLFRTRMCQARGIGNERYVLYGEDSGVYLVVKEGGLFAEVYSPYPDLLYEILYGLCLSLVGEKLDAMGIHRVHALGFQVNDHGILFPMEMGAGKSTLAMALRQDGNVRFFSDESPLLEISRKGTALLSFHSRIALSSDAMARFRISQDIARPFRRQIFPLKWLMGWDPKELASRHAVDFIVLDGGRKASVPSLTAVSRFSAFLILLRTMVIGIGVAQMAEFYLRFNWGHLWRLFTVGVSRFFLALRLVVFSKVSTYRFARTDDPLVNARYLVDFFQRLE